MPDRSDSQLAARPGRQRNKRGEGGELRNELIAAASRLLEDIGGEEALSLRSVAREAGIAAPSIYRHFADKHELVDAVLETRFAELRDLINTSARHSVDAADDLRVRARTYAAFAAEHPGSYRVMFTAIPLAPETRPIEQLPGAKIVVELADSIARCAATGATMSYDPLTTAILLWTTLHGIASLRASKPAFPWPPTHQLIDEALHLLCGLEQSTAAE